MGTRARCLAAAVSVAALVLAADAHPRGHRGGGWWYGPSAAYNSWTIQACLGTYRFQHNLPAYRYNVDYCFVEGRLTQVSHVIRGVLHQTRHWRTPLWRMKRREWRICLNTYRAIGGLFHDADVCHRQGYGIPVADVLVDIEAAYRAYGL